MMSETLIRDPNPESATPESTTAGALEKTALSVAKLHDVESRSRGPKLLLSRLSELDKQLATLYRIFVEASEQELALSLAAEWILDNHYVVEQALRQIEEDLPEGYYRELPKLTSGALAGQPRIYAVARAYLLYDGMEFDVERLQRFVDAYQGRRPLTMGELWALPIMSRIVLLESIVQAAGRITGAATADQLAATLPGFLPLDYRPDDNDVVGFAISTLRQINSADWPTFFEQVSLVHQILAGEPVGIYPSMDFDTRNRYREAVETLAKGSGQPEEEIAHAAVELARTACLANEVTGEWDGAGSPTIPLETPKPEPWDRLSLPRECHVGYHLVDAGRTALERRIRFRPELGSRIRRTLLAHPTHFYLSAIGLIALLVLAVAVAYGAAAGGSVWLLLLIAALTVVPALTLAVDLTNHLVTLLIPPRPLPKLDLEDGVPLTCRTMVVIPGLLSRASDVDALFDQIELHYLSNPDANQALTFALLTDFGDATEEVRPEDEVILNRARNRLVELNEKYSSDPFYFFHRRRLWNPLQQVWMGWERKRGKLHEFNQLLRGDQQTSFIVQLGELSLLSEVRYVITLDADTVLPRESAHRLVGALAHPLNRASFDPQSGKISAGYSILQPRTAVQPTSANRSRFTRIFAGDTGIDLYTLAVSDVYHDLFGAGIYVGKGIYDVDAFERSLAGRIPENALLSHDLFEGIHGRTGLVTDIVLYEDYPPHYLASILRTHRWVRGDWQLLPWLRRRAPSAEGPIPNDLTLIDRWKLFDNLRRSLLSPALLTLLVAGWTVLPGLPLLWTLLALVTPGLPLLLAAVRGAVQYLTSEDRVMTGRELRMDLTGHAWRWFLFMAFLPYEALLYADAITTTLARLYIRRRNLLEWTTAARTVRVFGDEVSATTTIMHMLPAHLLTAAIAVLVIYVAPWRIWLVAPFLVTWLLAWRVAYRISLPDTTDEEPLNAEQWAELHRLARHTWLFYEHYVGPEDNWLPPDHYQEEPRGTVAHRTSPTNVGMYLVAALGAYKMGYLGGLELFARLRSTFDSLGRLDRYRGHFLNWIDTRTLDPLAPRYVSAVDSGNLAVALVALKQGCLDQTTQPIWRWERWEGLLDTLALLDQPLATVTDADSSVDEPMRAYLAQVRQQVLAVRHQPDEWHGLLLQLAAEGRRVLDGILLASIEANGSVLDTELIQSLRAYVERVHHHLGDWQRELARLQPWLARFYDAPPYFTNEQAPPPIRQAWRHLRESLPAAPRLNEIAALSATARQRLAQLSQLLADEDSSLAEVTAAFTWCKEFQQELATAHATAEMLTTGFATLATQADGYVDEMDFCFLFDGQREVFHIGYNLDAGQLDRNYYDLLASEARMASLIAIAKYDVPQSHWLHLGRPLTTVATGNQALLSWSGTMFEYLMPPLLVRHYRDTLLYTSCEASIDHQIAYGRQKAVPWGISESGFYAFDAGMSYQYRAFGVPGLGFKRGLGDDLVIAPYASLLALPFRPQAVLENIKAFKTLGLWGRYGLYEAVDFTRSRLNFGQEYAIVREYMAHHQGMILLALVNLIRPEGLVDDFHKEPRIQSIELLLQEQVPRGVPPQYPHEDETVQLSTPQRSATADPWRVATNTPFPLVHYLSNGHYGVLMTNAGAGYSQTPELMLTRWRADTTLDDWGAWLYVEDVESGALWSAGLQPVGHWPEHLEVQFLPHAVEVRRRDDEIALHLAVTVAPEDDVEVRRITVTNDSDRPRRLRLTSYGEVALSPAGADLRHPAFGKLFIESDYDAESNLLVFRRRPRAATEAPQYLAHALVVEAGQPITGAYESDRARFLGRGRDVRQPAALTAGAATNGEWLSGTTGATLDPIMALGQELELPPHGAAQLALLTFTAPSRQALTTLMGRYGQWSTIERTFVRARHVAEQEMREFDLLSPQIERFQQLLSCLLYPHGARRAAVTVLAANEKNQSGLWAYGISGDYPILLVRLAGEDHGDLLQELLQAHSYWRRRGLLVDLVILNSEETHYGQALQGFIHRLIERVASTNWINQRGGIYILREDQLGEGDATLLQAVARVFLDGARGMLAEQLVGLLEQPTRLPLFEPPLQPHELPDATPTLVRPDNLRFDNGWGGFSADGREYVIFWQPGEEPTPAPWINVVANPEFGFLISESGGGYTWAENSGENRLTPWRNDPVSDLPGEALYLRDEETAEVWSPLPQPAPAAAPYLVRHGAGYSIFEHHSHNLRQVTRLFAVPDEPVKVVELRLENRADRPRRITVTYYAEWVLGVQRDSTQLAIIPEYDDDTHTLLARNPYSFEFSERVAFLSASKEPHSLTADRSEFLGRLGSLRRPAGLTRVGLSNRVQPGSDPCAVLQLHVDLAPGASEEVYFLLGQGANQDEALALAQRFQDREQVAAAWQGVEELWTEILEAVQVETPDPAMDFLLNRWLSYQSLACRIWGRSALYQSSGAYGFRDQLQDVMAAVDARPDVARDQILRAARHQFEDGDVLHWWHPPSGRGVRTRFTDDLLWLPFVTAHYVTTTGDETILAEEVPFVTGKPLAEGEEERYGEYEATPQSYSVLEHCRRALKRGTTAGPHGIPLIGGGDWNDGMNRVGIHGQGESIWLGWFLHATLTNFADLCDRVGDGRSAARYRQDAEEIRQALEYNGWDGNWYRRAYYDDGTPLGSAENRECRIDSIAQSWAVLSHAGDPRRAQQAMQAVLERLVKRDERLILLFTPPLDKTPKDPGYIKGYLPGVRENGGQYTHAALWTIWALAEMGDGDLAEELFRLINPIYRADTPAKAAQYKVEPYVISADVYSIPPHTGRGGWTWYTGSAGWMYRLGIEAILGLRRTGTTLHLNPCIPKAWPGFRLRYRYGKTVYEIEVKNPHGVNRGVCQVTLDGEPVAASEIPLVDDGGRHMVQVELGKVEQDHAETASDAESSTAPR
jgi:cyclic beta-1,2-glucan synthetase